MASSAALSQSMQRITTSKLNALSDQRVRYEEKKAHTLKAVADEPDLSGQVRLLLDGLEKHNVPCSTVNILPENVRRFLDQQKNDPSVTKEMLAEWKASLLRAFEIQSHRLEYTSLFGKLVTEWLDNPNDASLARRRLSNASEGSESQDSFEQVGRQEMYDQRRQWESLVLTNGTTSDPKLIQNYLSDLFGSITRSKKLTKTPLEELRIGMKGFVLGTFNTDSLDWCINSLIRTDLLSPTKRIALTEMQHNNLVRDEMIDVLNNHLETLSSWSWGEEPISLEIRRQLNGKYRVYMDEEILQALLLNFVGVKWAVHFKQAFTKFFHSGAWKQSSYKALDKKARARRTRFLGNGATIYTSVRNTRRERYRDDYFMTQLPSSHAEGDREYGDLDEEEMQQKKSPMTIKQSLLHLIATESLVNNELYGSFTILQSDFAWFGPSLPHSTILAVAEFFGVESKWLTFFRKFLEAPIRFAQDGPNAQVHTRRSGVPIQHALSDALGEAVLFCLDFAINQETSTNLYRFHDDIWFWGQDDVCTKAWQIIQRFSKVMGLSTNKEKTGTIQINSNGTDSSHSKDLPTGKIHWGFLTMDRSGQWVIDNEEVEKHIEELRRQLAACKSVLAMVQAWNVYVSKFFSTNFGHPANCLGQSHVDTVIETMKKIQQRLFAGSYASGSLTEYFRRTIAQRFGVSDIPDGFFYFPIEQGGLDLKNALVPLLLVREKSFQNPIGCLQEAFEKEEQQYQAAKKKYDDGTVSYIGCEQHKPQDDEPFMTLEEFTSFREETSEPLANAYDLLLSKPPTQDLSSSSDVAAALQKIPGEAKRANLSWSSLNSYRKWITQLYGPDVLKRFGGLGIGERALLPVGLATMLREEKVKWQG